MCNTSLVLPFRAVVAAAAYVYKATRHGVRGQKYLQSRSQYVHHFYNGFKTLIDHSLIVTMCAPMKLGAKDSATGAHPSHGGFIGAHMVVIELWSIKVLKSSQKLCTNWERDCSSSISALLEITTTDRTKWRLRAKGS